MVDERMYFIRGAYIRDTMEELAKNGNAYFSAEEIIAACKPRAAFRQFQADLLYLMQTGQVAREGSRLYLRHTLRYENFAAQKLAEILADNHAAPIEHPLPMTHRDVTLNAEQQEAVLMAESHRISLILGGAGSGKTALINVLGRAPLETVIAAPTGRAARNLRERTGLTCRTIHSALGKIPDEDFLDPVRWETVEMVVADEASMVSLEMLSGMLNRMNPRCRLVLLGDPYQLPAVGSGNVIPDLLALGVSSLTLKQQYRQGEQETALRYNVTQFHSIPDAASLHYDDSFQFWKTDEGAICDTVCAEAAKRYLAGENVQIIAPTKAEVRKLNQRMQGMVNPPAKDIPDILYHGEMLRENDRVANLVNDRDQNCSNGDLGTLHISDDPYSEYKLLATETADKRTPTFLSCGREQKLALAYAMTVHKSQGSQYDTVIMPLSVHSRMLTRNFLYTAISRSTKQLILVGSDASLSTAMQTLPAERRSMLIAKTHQIQRMNGGTAA